MTSVYRLVVSCDENGSDKCLGLVEYSGPDRHALKHNTNVWAGKEGKTAWLQGYTAKGTYDVCPACRPAVEARLEQQRIPTPAQPDPAA